jgi:hypothetical protein
MPEKSHIRDGHVNWYALEPGDGTLYRFAYVCLGSLNDNRWTGRFGHIFPGVGDGSSYVGVLINMPSGQGFYELMIDSIREPHAGFVSYVQGHMPGVRDRYTVAAVLMALSVLVDNPTDYNGACEAMLRAREIM